jgi:hypothetical protein
MRPSRWRDLEKPDGYRSPLARSEGMALKDRAKNWARKESAKMGTPQNKAEAFKELDRLFAA